MDFPAKFIYNVSGQETPGIQRRTLMKKFIEDFRKFSLRGKAMDLTVGVVVGGALGKAVSSLVADVVMPLIGILLGGVNFKELSLTVGSAVLRYGSFIQTIVDFIIIAFTVFVIIRVIDTFYSKNENNEADKAESVALLEEIRDLLKNRDDDS
jgi:large conductance mechanosensitive channel